MSDEDTERFLIEIESEDPDTTRRALVEFVERFEVVDWTITPNPEDSSNGGKDE